MNALLRRIATAMLPLLLIGGSLKPAAAQAADRIAARPNLTSQTQLSGHLPAWATASAQSAKAVDLSSRVDVLVMLKRDDATQAAFEQLLADQQDPTSPKYHKWLTPQQLGGQFGPSLNDIQAVSSWLTSQGLTVQPVNAARLAIQVSGTAATVANAFRTNFAYYNVNGEAHFAVNTEPSIPAALSPVISGVQGLVDDMLAPQHVKKEAYRADYALNPAGSSSDIAGPEYTTGGGNHYLTPGDFAVIYNLNPVYSAGNKGATIGPTAQHIAIVGRSRVSATDVSTFASFSGVTGYTLNTILATATDPGTTHTGDQDEATLDVDRVISTAPGAIADLIISSSISSDLNYNAGLSTPDTIVSISFGACESAAGPGTVANYDSFFQSTAALGVSTFVSSGDSGVAGCNSSFANPPTTQTAGINYICSSAYVTCVGGTEFADTTSPSTYWSSTNSTSHVSVLSYIPEGAWNEPSSGGQTSSGFWLSATGGGPSIYINKPTWQTAATPADGKRDTPDISFSASGHDGYYACLDYALSSGSCATGSFFAFSGTSASAPGMAGIAALINTKLGAAQGNMNPLLYRIYGSTPSAFHDATPASSGVSSCSLTTASICNNSTPSSSGLTGGLQGYALLTGYDEATGLGSMDVSAFITAAAPTTGTFTLSTTSSSLSLPVGATTGNTNVITVTSTGGFTAPVGLSCAATLNTGTASVAPVCTMSPTSVTPSAGGTATSTATIGTQAQSTTCTTQNTMPMVPWKAGGEVLAAFALILLPLRKRKAFRSLMALGLLALGLGLVSGCGSGGSTGGGACTTHVVAGTTTGAYTVTVTGTSGSITVTKTFSLTVN